MALEQAVGAMNNAHYLSKELESAIFSSEEARKGYSEAQANATVASANSTAQAAVIGADAIAAEQAQHQQLLRAVGLDILDPASALNEELTREQTIRREREALDKSIVEMESVNFFENPFKFLMVQPQLQKATAQYNGLAREENRASAEVARMQSLATTIRAVTPAKNADLLRQKAVAEGDAIKKQAEATANQINAQNAAGHAKSLLDAYTLRRNIFADILQVENLVDNKAARAEARADRQMRHEDAVFWRNVKRQDLLEREEDKRKAKEQETAIVQGINLYRRAISGNTSEFTIEDIKRMPADQREAWFGVVFRGNYGNNYNQALPFIENYGNMAGAADAGAAAMMAQLRTIKMTAEKMVPQIQNQYMAQNAGKTLKYDDALKMAMDNLYNQDRTYGLKGSDKSLIPPTSPYAIDWNSLANGAVKAEKKGLIGEILVDLKARAPGANLTTSVTPRGVLEEIAARVAVGKVDPKTAAEETARFFALNTALNYEQTGMKYLALPQMTDFTITPGSSGNEKVDLMNPTQLEAYLTARVAQQRRINSKGFLDRGIMHWTEEGYKK